MLSGDVLKKESEYRPLPAFIVTITVGALINAVNPVIESVNKYG
jgi:hypothetical protein